jgi:hypothetical protein
MEVVHTDVFVNSTMTEETDYKIFKVKTYVKYFKKAEIPVDLQKRPKS